MCPKSIEETDEGILLKMNADKNFVQPHVYRGKKDEWHLNKRHLKTNVTKLNQPVSIIF